jgi:hypothetical protein
VGTTGLGGDRRFGRSGPLQETKRPASRKGETCGLGGTRALRRGAQHASIEEAFEDADADGTRSILDLDHFSEEPDFGAVTPLPIYFVRRGVKR